MKRSGADLLVGLFVLLGFAALVFLALRAGNMSDIPENDPVWGSDEEAIVRDWCARAGINYGGRAVIGHDSGNRVVPFGRV